MNLRRLIVGGRGASSPGQVTAAVTYTTDAGTPAGATALGQPIGIGQYTEGHTNTYCSVCGVFTTDPVYDPSATLHYLSFNSEGGSEKLKWESGEFARQGVSGTEGILLYSVNATPSGFLYTVTFEMDLL
jgi:hypothetical protein